jgi:hypothetical protein
MSRMTKDEALKLISEAKAIERERYVLAEIESYMPVRGLLGTKEMGIFTIRSRGVAETLAAEINEKRSGKRCVRIRVFDTLEWCQLHITALERLYVDASQEP